MKSEKGALLLMTLKVVVLILICGVVTYVLVTSDLFTKDNKPVNTINTNEVNSTITK